jgi:class 3 adenylate cyclase
VDIAAWLRSLGLERYEEAFRENEVDWEVLPELNEADLERLGLPLGPRKKLLKAIREHAGGPDAAPTATPVGAPPNLAVPASLPRPEAERRQLTVMFADLVGSTELASCLDPEEMREIITAYQGACTDVVERFEGHVALYLGDGVIAFFGYPRAHEDDAERAVRAGLDLVEEIAALRPRGVRLRTRIGIDTGLVVGGDLLGKGMLQQEGLVGDVPNLAARLQALAPPDSVVVSPGTRRLVGYVFDYADLGEQRLKGFAAPIRAWRVLGLSAAEGRFGARSAAGLTPLVGREREIGLLLERWEQAKTGEGQVAMLVGEAGIGKSRIVQAFNERLAG